MRILLIAPRPSDMNDKNPGWLRIPQLSLSILAALTPPGHETVVREEEVEDLPLEEHWDVVGITSMTATANRAYELASHFRQRGAKTVLGGIHPSVMPDEAARFADAVVVGEAEGIWERVLADIEGDRLEKIYLNTHPDLSGFPRPLRRKRRSLLGLPPVVLPVMASRGCPHDCEFCCVNKVYGRKQRHIPVDEVVEDLEKSGTKIVMFLDDNIWGDRSYATLLFERIRPLGLKWVGQASAKSILDGELFDAAVASGLRGLFVGVESVESEVFTKMRKSLASTGQYEEAIRRCREAGVSFHASLIFGLDNQTPEVFDKTLDFLIRNSIPSISPNILTPYPGTRLRERLLQEGRILHDNWAYYDHQMVSFKPMNMEAEELAERYLDFRKRFFSWSSIFWRGFAQLRISPVVYLATNLAYRRATRDYQVRSRKYFEWLRNEKRESAAREVQSVSHAALGAETGF